MITVIFNHNFEKDGVLGLIVNFSAVLIICEFDDIVMKLGRIQKLREEFDNIEDESRIPNEDLKNLMPIQGMTIEERRKTLCPTFYKLGDRKYSNCGFLKFMVPKEENYGDNDFVLLLFLFSCNDKNTIKQIKNWWKSIWINKYLSIGLNVGTMHKLLIIISVLILFIKTVGREDPKNVRENDFLRTDFKYGALRSGGVL